MRISDLQGLGAKSEKIFSNVGIHSVDDFLAINPFELYRKLKQADKSTGLNSIYAIIGAREGLHWQEIARTRKEEILYRLDDMGLAPK